VSEPFDPTAVDIRPAATVMLVRDVVEGDPGIEVFMMRRTGSASFAAGAYVFPGGRVDGIDGAAEIAPFCRGLDDADASAQLGVPAGGLAFWVAAVRECFEEAGLLMAERRDGEPVAVGPEDRHAVHDGSLPMVDLCRRDDLVLDLSTTHYVAHWITPLGEKRRFDTRFFLTEAPPGQEGIHDDKETVESLWVRPAEALRMQAAGELMMLPPTIVNLQFLAEHDTAAAAVAAGEAEPPSLILPRLRRNQDGRITGVAMPGDPDFDGIEVDDPIADEYLAGLS
jgi:8-oxo-dGTP pyrophosphatase MutT (NUDIX family)